VAIPTASEIIGEVLRLISDGLPHEVPIIREQLPSIFSLTAEEQRARLPSGRETQLANRWRNAVFRMRQKGLVVFLPSDRLVITDGGRKRLETSSSER
jgi:restriction endonuclease Mrr